MAGDSIVVQSQKGGNERMNLGGKCGQPGGNNEDSPSEWRSW